MELARQRVLEWLTELGIVAGLGGASALVVDWLSRQFAPPTSTLLIGLVLVGLGVVGIAWQLGLAADRRLLDLTDSGVLGGIGGGMGFLVAVHLVEADGPLLTALVGGAVAGLYCLVAAVWIVFPYPAPD